MLEVKCKSCGKAGYSAYKHAKCDCGECCIPASSIGSIRKKEFANGPKNFFKSSFNFLKSICKRTPVI